MKKGFSLIEMLIVVLVLVTLMTMTFKLSSIGADQSARNVTISRMNRIENCLSGYYAAFGSYPPVKQHGSPNIYAAVSDHGMQSETQENADIWGWDPDDLDTSAKRDVEAKAWEQVKAACKVQPVDCRFPYPADSAYESLVKTVSDAIRKKANDSKSLSETRKRILTQPFDNGVSQNFGRHELGVSDWRETHLFKFGLMSFLLPRYLVMMNSSEDFFQGKCLQWEENNAMPCNPLTGFSFAQEGGWKRIRERSRSTKGSELAEVANIPSQAVTARWMPNLEGIVCCNHDFKLFGISIRGDTSASDLRADNLNIEVYTPGGYDDASGTAGQYVLDSVTVLDGWQNEFYYYSAPPYQNYTLWSSGANGRTFPPWVSRAQLQSAANKCIGYWIKDDIVRMSH